MNILITGGAGFIGSHLVRALLKNQYEVIIFKKKATNTWRVNDIEDRISIYNLEEITSLDFILKKHKIDTIIHLAGKYIKLHKSEKDILEMNKSNIDFPATLLEAATKNNVSIFINTGTFFEYKLKGVLSERSVVEPYDYYAATKLAFEQILKFYSQTQKIKAVTLKLFSPYGEKDNKKIIPLILRSMILNKSISVTKGDQQLSFTYIGDVIDAYLKTIKFINSKKFCKYEVFNIGSNQSWSIKQLVKKIEDNFHKKIKVKFGVINNNKDEDINIRCDSTKANKLLKWYPKISLENGLRQTYNYLLSKKKDD